MKADSKADTSAAPASTKKLILLVAISALVVGLGGGGAWYFLRPHDAGASTEHKTAKAEPPEYVPIEQFVVNLQPENGEQYLQIAFTLQVGSQKDGEVIKANMAKVRSRILLLLSGHKASEISSVDGKKLLSKEIRDAVNLPFVDKGDAQKVSDVLFTAFIIQ